MVKSLIVPTPIRGRSCIMHDGSHPSLGEPIIHRRSKPPIVATHASTEACLTSWTYVHLLNRL